MRLRRLPILAEAAMALVLARLLLALVPPRHLLGRMQPPGDAVTPPPIAPGDGRAAAVATALTVAGRHLPWRCSCLVMALAGRMMLTRRRIPSVLHLGVDRRDGALAAHAWLEAAGGMVCGGAEAAGFNPLARQDSRRR